MSKAILEATHAHDYAAGRKAYDAGEKWDSKQPKGWRVGWVQRQQEKTAERAVEKRMKRYGWRGS